MTSAKKRPIEDPFMVKLELNKFLVTNMFNLTHEDNEMSVAT